MTTHFLELVQALQLYKSLCPNIRNTYKEDDNIPITPDNIIYRH